MHIYFYFINNKTICRPVVLGFRSGGGGGGGGSMMQLPPAIKPQPTGYGPEMYRTKKNRPSSMLGLFCHYHTTAPQSFP